MKNVIRFGLAAGLAGALVLSGSARAQTSSGQPGSGTGSGSPDSVGKGDTSRPETSPSMGGASSGSSSTGSSGTGSSGSATGGAGASAGSGSTTAGAPSAGQKLDPKLKERLEKIHAANQAEVQMAQLGAQTAQSPEVKQFAEQMQTDHQKFDDQLTQAAQAMGVTLEGKDFQKAQQDATKDQKKLQSKTGQDFDKAYMSKMVKDHEKDLKDVKGAAKDAQKANHSELASLLQQAETSIQGHLDHAKQVQKTIEKKGDQGGQRQGRRPSGSSSGMSGSSGGTSSSGATTPDQPRSGSRGDTGGPTPGGADRGTGSGTTVTPHGGEAGTSSDPGTRKQ